MATNYGPNFSAAGQMGEYRTCRKVIYGLALEASFSLKGGDATRRGGRWHLAGKGNALRLSLLHFTTRFSLVFF